MADKKTRDHRYLAAAAVILVMIAAALCLRKSVQKTALTETAGRTFEKGIVTEVVTDNMQASLVSANPHMVKFLLEEKET